MLHNLEYENELKRIKNKHEEMNLREEIEYEDYKNKKRNDNLREYNRYIEEKRFEESAGGGEGDGKTGKGET